MAARDDEDRREARSPGRGRALLRLFYGAGLVAIGACLGIVIGSLSETPRLLLERLRGPVETVEVGSPASATGAAKPGAAPLERFGELQEGKAPKPAAAPAKPAPETAPPPEFVPAEELPTPAPAAPPVASAPPPAAAPTAGATKAPLGAKEASAAKEPPAPKEPPAAKAPPEEKPSAAVKPPGGPVVQVASYVDRKPADELVVKLESTGFDAYVSQPAAANGRYRVRIRPNAGETAADLAKRLRGFGFDTWATSE